MVFDKKQYAKEYRENHKEQAKEYNAWYNQTPQGKFVNTINSWKESPKNGYGLICENREEIEGIYMLYICSERCEECNCPYTKENKKCMDHCHETGNFRNILCHSCNRKRNTKQNSSGTTNISWYKYRNCWIYQIIIKGKKHNKKSKDLEWLKEYKLEYEKNNIYIH